MQASHGSHACAPSKASGSGRNPSPGTVRKSPRSPPCGAVPSERRPCSLSISKRPNVGLSRGEPKGEFPLLGVPLLGVPALDPRLSKKLSPSSVCPRDSVSHSEAELGTWILRLSRSKQTAPPHSAKEAWISSKRRSSSSMSPSLDASWSDADIAQRRHGQGLQAAHFGARLPGCASGARLPAPRLSRPLPRAAPSGRRLGPSHLTAS